MNKAIAAALLLSASAASAQVAMLGIPSCGSWVGERTDHERGWLAGYLSGAAAFGNTDFIQGTDFPSIELWMEKFCREKPLENLNTGANKLIVELRARKAKGIKR